MERVVKVLNKMTQEGIIQDYAIGGAMAALFYSEPIETFDLDVFVALKTSKSSLISLGPLYDYLKARGYQAKKEHIVIESIPVQFLVPYDPLIEEALEQAVEKKFGQEPVRVFSVEHLMAIMAQTGRPKDKIRLQSLLQQAKYDKKFLEDILRRHGLVSRWKVMVK
ncbi:MAG: hypothetical protein HY747_01635 [Elusimicrobia bacterium]|nr:hypothetical protein [Elusimicrobiota bacterium]